MCSVCVCSARSVCVVCACVGRSGGEGEREGRWRFGGVCLGYG